MVQRRRSRYEMKIQCTIWEWLKQVVSGRDILKWIQGENVSVTERYYQSTRIVNDFIHFIELLLHNRCNTEPYCEWFHEEIILSMKLNSQSTNNLLRRAKEELVELIISTWNGMESEGRDTWSLVYHLLVQYKHYRHKLNEHCIGILCKIIMESDHMKDCIGISGSIPERYLFLTSRDHK